MVRIEGTLTPEYCVALGGHCWVDTGVVLTTIPPMYPEKCKHCPATRTAIPQPDRRYLYPEGQA